MVSALRPLAARSAGPALLLTLGCSGPLNLGTDLVWTAEHESGDLSEWLGQAGGDTHLPSPEASVAASAEQAHRGSYSVKLINPAVWDGDDEGPELWKPTSALEDAYYSAWFLVPEDYAPLPSLTLVRLRSREPGQDEFFSGEQLQLRGLATGGYLLMVMNNNAEFLREPVAEPAPLVATGRWFQLEARYEPRSQGRLRVWLDGALAYDLQNRPGGAGSEVVFSLCNATDQTASTPVTVFVDDAAISLTRVSPTGQLGR